MKEKIEAAIAPMREAIQADGADLEVKGIDGSVAHIALVFGPEVCEDCILPKDMLQTMLLSAVKDTLPEISEIVLDDPREQAVTS